MTQWRRYVAVGDSFTEGLDDAGPDGRFRGWADRVAAELARSAGDGNFEYANLAIRGRTLLPILQDQVPAAVALQPDLISIAGGVNDVLRPRWDLESMMAAWEEALPLAKSGGADVVIVTFGQLSGRSRVLGSIEERLRLYREELLALARRERCRVVDFWYATVFNDSRFWSPDRLHLNAIGHQRAAWAALDTLGFETPDWLAPLPHEPGPSHVARLAGDAAWIGGHLAPWLGRRLLGRSSGDGVLPKRPVPAPVLD